MFVRTGWFWKSSLKLLCAALVKQYLSHKYRAQFYTYEYHQGCSWVNNCTHFQETRTQGIDPIIDPKQATKQDRLTVSMLFTV